MNKLLCGESTAGIVGTTIETAISAISVNKGATTLGTNARGYLVVDISLGSIDVARMGSVVHLLSDVLHRKIVNHTN